MRRNKAYFALVMVALLGLSACSNTAPNRQFVSTQDAQLKYAHLYSDLDTGQYDKAVFNWMAK